MSYYDSIARQWHAVTGYAGGAFKELVLNDVLIGKLPPLGGRAVLELGAGNGYFLPLALRRLGGQAAFHPLGSPLSAEDSPREGTKGHSVQQSPGVQGRRDRRTEGVSPSAGGQTPARIVISDQSGQLLSIARRQFNLPSAEYLNLDVRGRFPFDDAQFDLIIASMLFNELPERGLRSALGECRRVLARDGLLLLTVLHPDFVNSLLTGGAIRREPDRAMTMPGAGSLRLPVVIRSEATYRSALAGAGFACEAEPVFATEAVRSARPGLRNAGAAPVALVFMCRAATLPLPSHTPGPPPP